MKKRILLSLVFLSLVFCAISQSAALDAIELTKHVNRNLNPVVFNATQTELNQILTIIKRYYPSITQTTAASIMIRLTDSSDAVYNPILADLLAVTQPSGVAPLSISSLITGAGNMNVTNFADGVAKFLVKRGKEELTVAFFRKLEDFLKKYPEIKILFPSTIKIIGVVPSYNYPAILPALKAAFQKDYNEGFADLLKLRDVTNYENYATDGTIKARANKISKFLTDELSGRAISAGLVCARGIVQGNNAATIISNIANDKSCADHASDNFSNAVFLADLLSKSFLTNEEGRVWVKSEQAAQLVSDDVTVKIYLGLLYAMDQNNVRPIAFVVDAAGTTTTLKKILVKINGVLGNAAGNDFRNTLGQIATAASNVADAAKNIIDSKKQNIESAYLSYADFASAISLFLKDAVTLIPANTKVDNTFSFITKDIEKITSILDDLTGAAYDIKSKNYGSLVIHSSLILKEILGSDYNYQADFIKYATFMGNIASAKSSDEIETAIESSVLPVGSSSIKRETDFNVSINAYIGAFGGAEYIPQLKEKNWAFSTGITAPVGIAFSFGNLKCKKDDKEKGGKSISIFVPIIDVGSIASFRLANDSSSVASQIQLKNIIAPGLFLYYGFGRCPLSLGIGAQLGPQLRDISAKDINFNKNYYFRFGLNLVVDIPFFNLYTKGN